MEELDFSDLLARYSDKGRKGFYPLMMYAVITYANMQQNLFRRLDRRSAPERSGVYPVYKWKETELFSQKMAMAVNPKTWIMRTKNNYIHFKPSIPAD